ncbi:MAG TPA: ABC transporter permease [Bacteroidia bacterium]|nr:ABC transporter permease [Bacteroidia bacterium]
MNPINLITHIGRYALLLKQVFRATEKRSIFWNRFFYEVNSIGIGSLGIVSIISVFMGAVITIQSAFGFESPWIPLYAVGYATRDSIILEFSPTIVSLILAGKVGSSIASEIGNMRVSEQIDALDVMGVNSASFLILPKIIASIFIFPFVVIISMFLGHIGGFVLGVLAGVVTPYEFVYGVQYEFRPYYLFYSLLKTMVFGFIIPSVSAYHGYYARGGSLEVGQASTRAVVYSIIVLLLFNFILTQLLLA